MDQQRLTYALKELRWIWLFVFPLKMRLAVGYNLIRLFDILIAFWYIGNFNFYKLGFVFYLNLIFIVFFLTITLLTFFRPKKYKMTFYVYYRLAFLGVNLVIHFTGMMYYIVSKKRILENFYSRSNFRPDESDFYAYINKLITVSAIIIYVDLVYISWTLFLRALINKNNLLTP